MKIFFEMLSNIMEYKKLQQRQIIEYSSPQTYFQQIQVPCKSQQASNSYQLFGEPYIMINLLFIYISLLFIPNPQKMYISILICLISLALAQDIKVCEGNRFKHKSSYAIGRMTDLKLTFEAMNYTVGDVTFKDQVYRTYKINETQITTTFLMAKQTATIEGVSNVRFTGGTVRVNFKFSWHKKQLSSEIHGVGQGQVYTDAVTFVKSLDVGLQTKQLEWNLVSADPVVISNSLSLQKISPYKEADYEIINQMLNNLKTNDTTLKANLVTSLNLNYHDTLKRIVHENTDTDSEPQQIFYTYSDYHGEIQIGYDNIMLTNRLSADGLDLLMSQTIKNYSQFQCGEKVPDVPEDRKKYGGIQQFISNKFFMSNLRYTLQKGFLDIVLSEENWQSHAFQFFVGDLHEVMPSTKNQSSLDTLTGKCKALDDKVFSFARKTDSSYDVKVNFTCELNYNKTKILAVLIVVNYEVQAQLTTDALNFMIVGIEGTPQFIQTEGYQIKNMDLANFMVAETLSMAKQSLVLGSGYKTVARKNPQLQVRDSYLFMYDSGVKGTQKSQKIK